MKFNVIDLENWSRKTHFEFYIGEGKCAFNITVNIDVTALMNFIKMYDHKFYPTFIYIVSKAMNDIVELKTRVNDAGIVGYWDFVSPTYTVFHEDDKTFSSIYTEYGDNFNSFYSQIIEDIQRFKDVKGICAKPAPKNCFHISCIPWINYTGFSLQLYSGNYLAPIVSWGKFDKSSGKILLPLSLQVHHAIADGYHISKVIDVIRCLSSTPDSIK